MKAPLVFGSFLALAGTAIAAERADASIKGEEIVDDALKSAICSQDWYQAIELSSRLIISPKVSPDYRQTLLGWRNHFYRYAKTGERKGRGPSCDQAKATAGDFVQPRATSAPMPRFSSVTPVASAKNYCPPGAKSDETLSDRTSVGYSFLTDSYIGHNFVSDGVADDESGCISDESQASNVDADIVGQPSPTSFADLWTVGVRVEGNNLKGKVLNNGWNTFRNVKLVLRSRSLGKSTNIKTVAIDTVRAWSETEFVAGFADTPGDWVIERIEVN